MTGIFQGLKQAMRNSNLFKVLTCGAAGAPTVPGRVIVDESAQGMRLLHTADTITEAGWLQQALAEAGFYMEYVPSTAAGIFGITGNNSIYVRPEEYNDARDFLDEYLNAPVEPQDDAEADNPLE